MTPERWAQVNDLLHRAIRMAPEEQSTFLNGACANDQALRQEVESLLAANQQIRSSFLESPLADGLAKGTRLGEYEVQSLLGSGGMGEVYRARDLRLRREVAIKVLPAFATSDPERLRRFEQEAMAAAALNHPNILAVFQMGTHEGAPYLVSELLDGETLREKVKRGPLALRKAIDFNIQIARGLAAAHDKGIVHRDLKPENLFATKDGRVKILDFGLAKLTQTKADSANSAITVGEKTEPGVVMGTAGYMSPEQVRGEAADHRADIFAFGAIFYEMLTGRRAFQKPTAAETMAAILKEEPAPISQIALQTPPALQRIVHRCLEKSPDLRFRSASDLAFALEALSEVNSSTSQAVATPRSGIPWKWITVVAVAIVVAVVLSGWWFIPPAVPVVEAVTQLTNDGVPKQGQLATDGSRIYFSEGATGSLKIAQVAVAGGETGVVPAGIRDPQIAVLTPDRSGLLVMAGGFLDPEYPLWIVPIPAGEPRRLGSLKAKGASVFPDGRIAFARGSGLYVAQKDGTNVQQLLTSPGAVRCPNVSPNGKSIVLKTVFPGDFWMSLAEVNADGSGMHAILKPAQDAPLSCAQWTVDGRYLVYQTGSSNSNDIWMLPLQKGILRATRNPTPLTQGPLSYSGAVPSPDGKHVFAIGTKERGELIRYDTNLKAFLPFLSSTSAIEPAFSRDGKWMAYVTYPERSLWRSRTDGTDRLQLTYPPVEAAYPSISRDGKRISFGTGRNEIYVIGMDGEGLHKIIDQVAPVSSWSPDGNFLLLNVRSQAQPGQSYHLEFEILDLRHGNTTLVPYAQGLAGPLWIGNDALIGSTQQTTKILTYSLKKKEWTELVSGTIVDTAVSTDSRYLYYTTGGEQPKVMRLNLSNRQNEEITSLRGLRRVIADGSTFMAVAPDGSPIFTRDIGSQEIYSLQVKW